MIHCKTSRPSLHRTPKMCDHLKSAMHFTSSINHFELIYIVIRLKLLVIFTYRSTCVAMHASSLYPYSEVTCVQTLLSHASRSLREKHHMFPAIL